MNESNEQQQVEEEINGLEVRFYESQCLGEDNVNKFEKTGYLMIDSILFSDVYQIHKKTLIPMETIYQIQTNLQRIFASVPVNGSQLLKNSLEQTSDYTSGIQLLDDLLDGKGFKSGEIYELAGPTSCGKTQISMVCSLSLASCLKNVIYIDSSNSFSSSRLTEIYKTNYYYNNYTTNTTTTAATIAVKQNNCLKILDRIKVFNCFESITLIELLTGINNQLQERTHNEFYKGLRLIVIDSIGTILSPIIGGKQTQGHFMMMTISRILKNIADTYQIVFLITNNIVSSGSGGGSGGNNNNNFRDYNSDNNKAALGEAWAMVPNHQLMINHHYYDDENEERSIYIEKSTRLPKKSKIKAFKIRDNGIVPQ